MPATLRLQRYVALLVACAAVVVPATSWGATIVKLGELSGKNLIVQGDPTEKSSIRIEKTSATTLLITRQDSASYPALLSTEGPAGVTCNPVNVPNSVTCTVSAADTYTVYGTMGPQADKVELSGIAATMLNGGGGGDYIAGSALVDFIYGGTGNDTIEAGDGPDWLFGDDDSDNLRGGPGNDFLIGGKGPDALDGQEGDSDIADYLSECARLLNDCPVRQSHDGSRTTGITASLDGVANDGSVADDGANQSGPLDNISNTTEWVWGTRFADTLTGSDRGGELLNGWSGDDYIDAKGGDDRMLGDSHDDILVADDGVKDSEVNCDNSSEGIDRGTQDVASIDGVDRPFTSSCETVNEAGGGGTGGGAGGGAGSGSGSSGGSGASAPTGPNPSPCATSIRVGPLKIDAEACMARDGMVWTATGKVAIGGLDFLPNGGGAKLIIDPLNLSLRAKGSWSVVLEGSIGRTPVGPVTLYSGEFTWSYQYRPNLRDIAGLFQAALPGEGVSFASIAKLPGLTNAPSLPQLPKLGLPDYSAVKDSAVKQLMAKIPSLGSREVSIDLRNLGMSALPTVRIGPTGIDWGGAPGAGKDQSGSLFGLPLSGAVEVQAVERGGIYGSRVAARLALPSVLSGVTANAELFIGQNGSVTVISAGSTAGQIGVPPIYLSPFKLAYEGSTDTWSGDTRLFFGIDPEIGFGGRFVITRGVLQSLGIRSAGIPAPFGPTAVFDQLDGTAVFNPLNVTADVVVGFGPKVPALNAKMFSVDGRAEYDSTQQRISLTGGASSAGTRLLDAKITYWFSGMVEAEGRMSRFLDSNDEYGFEGVIKGEASLKGANLEGSVDFRAKSLRLNGKGLLSTRGVAACATARTGFRDVELGAGYKWGDRSITWLGGSCDFAPFRARVATETGARETSTGPQQITVGPRQKALVMQVRGASGPPRLSIAGPGGRVVESPADNQPVQADGYIIIPQPSDQSTYVAIAAPERGTWTITPLDGADIAPVLTAQQLPPARVSGSLAKGRLRFSASRIAGQVIRFTEQGRETSREIGSTTKATGSIGFTPMRGPAGPRSIIATVEQDGMPRARVTIARFRATAPGLAKPRVRVSRGAAGGATVRWSRVAGAKRYEVMASYNGSSYAHLALAGTRSLALPDVLRTSPLAVRVRAVSDYPRYGPYGTTTVQKATRTAPPRRKGGRR